MTTLNKETIYKNYPWMEKIEKDHILKIILDILSFVMLPKNVDEDGMNLMNTLMFLSRN